jgi:hypothetical protein
LQNSLTELVIDANGLSSGIYLVSLMAEGRLVATQKMAVE